MSRITFARVSTLAVTFVLLPTLLQGQFVYVVNQVTDNVSGYAINPVTGALTAVPGSPFPAGSDPRSVAVDPTGRFAYVANANSNNLSGYAIDPVTGALTAIVGSPFPTGGSPRSIVVHPDGKFVYVANGASNNVWGLTINPTTGALAPVPASPFPLPAAPGEPESLAVVPSGGFLYVYAHLPSNGIGANISGYTINTSTGALSTIPSSPFPSGAFSFLIVADPTGKFLFDPDANSDTLLGFVINSVTGALTPNPPVPPGFGFFPSYAAVHPSGRFIYETVSNGPGTVCSVLGYTIDATTGLLTAIPGSPFPGDSCIFAVGVEPTGKFLYASSFPIGSLNPGHVVGYAIDAVTGALTALPSSPFPAGKLPFSMAFQSATVPAIIAQVQALLTAGALSPDQGAGLIDKLNAIIAKLNSGQTGAACNQLSAFINQVNGFVKSASLTPAQAQSLIITAEALETKNGC